MFHSDLLLLRRISFSPPQPPPTAAITAAGDFQGSSSPAENHRFRSAGGRSTCRWPPRQKPASHAPSRAALLRQTAVHAPARECACGCVAPSPVTGLHSQGRPAPSWCSSPPTVHSEHSFSTFLPPPHCLEFFLLLAASDSRTLYGLGPLFLHLQAPQP